MSPLFWQRLTPLRLLPTSHPASALPAAMLVTDLIHARLPVIILAHFSILDPDFPVPRPHLQWPFLEFHFSFLLPVSNPRPAHLWEVSHLLVLYHPW